MMNGDKIDKGYLFDEEKKNYHLKVGSGVRFQRDKAYRYRKLGAYVVAITLKLKAG